MQEQKAILIVDDDSEIRRSMALELADSGYKTLPCARGALVAHMADKLKPVLILLDVHFKEGFNGFQLCALLKQNQSTRDIPVVMMSGRFLRDEFAMKARQAGAAGFFRKGHPSPSLSQSIQAALQAPTGARLPVAALSPGESAPHGTVLVADDDDEWVQLTSAWLGEAGYRVVAVRDELSVSAMALRHRPDCIVLDYQMGRQTAPEVCLQLQKDAATRAIPVIIHTGNEQGKAVCLDIGADQFVLKGATPEELLRAVKASIRRRDWSTGVVVNGDIRLDPRERSIHLSDELLGKLPDNQFQFLSTLVLRSPQYVTRQELSKDILGRPDAREESKALDKLVSRLKENVGAAVGKRIHHIRNLGWLYEVPLPAPDVPHN